MGNDATQEVLTGWFTKFNTSNTFNTGIAGRLYLVEAPQDPTYPYAVTQEVSSVPSYTFDTEMQNILVQLTIYSKEILATEITSLTGYARDLFDWTSLSLTNWTSIYVRPDLITPLTKEDGIWMQTIQYRIEVQNTE